MTVQITNYGIKAVVAEYFNLKTNILAVSTRDFVDTVLSIESLEDVTSLLKEVCNEISDLMGFEIKNTLLVLPSTFTTKKNDKTKVDVISPDLVITKDEIAAGVQNLIKQNDDHRLFVTNVEIEKYLAYGYGYVSNPVGLETRYIELEASVYTIPSSIAYPIIKAVEDAGLNIVDVSIDIVATATEAMIPAAMKTGGIVIDMTHDATNIGYFKNNHLCDFHSIPIGSKHISSDISLCAHIDFEKAEGFKKKYVNLDLSKLTEMVVYRYYDEVEDKNVEITQDFISEVALSRVEEIFIEIRKYLLSLNLTEDELIYVCGGANKIDGLDVVCEKYFTLPYEIYIPKTIGARDSGLTDCLGMIKYQAVKSRERGEIKLLVSQNDFLTSIKLVEDNNLLYNSNNSGEKKFIERLVSYIFNN